MRVLVSAPYVGEIGWELMSWQGRVRRALLAGGFDRLVVLGGAGKEAFYADMKPEYIAVDLSMLPGVAYEDRRIAGPEGEPIPASMIRSEVEPLVESKTRGLRESGCDVQELWPSYSGTIHPCDRDSQEFIRFERPCAEPRPTPWVVLVQRSRSLGAANWPTSEWTMLAAMLEARGISTSVYPCESASAMAAASHCDLAVGQSTGGLHLASLCGCPHVVWSVSEPCLWTPWQITNRQRYETFWNPLGTPAQFHHVDRHPSCEEVLDWVLRGLRTIGRHTGSIAAKAAFRARWRARRWLVRRIVTRDSFRRWPWPMQRFVRYQLI